MGNRDCPLRCWARHTEGAEERIGAEVMAEVQRREVQQCQEWLRCGKAGSMSHGERGVAAWRRERRATQVGDMSPVGWPGAHPCIHTHTPCTHTHSQTAVDRIYATMVVEQAAAGGGGGEAGALGRLNQEDERALQQ